MANDRVFLQCSCGAWKMLLKHYPGALSTWNNDILPWLDNHGACHPHVYDVDLKGDPGFKLLTESSEEFDAIDVQKQNAEPSDKAEEK